MKALTGKWFFLTLFLAVFFCCSELFAQGISGPGIKPSGPKPPSPTRPQPTPPTTLRGGSGGQPQSQPEGRKKPGQGLRELDQARIRRRKKLASLSGSLSPSPIVVSGVPAFPWIAHIGIPKPKDIDVLSTKCKTWARNGQNPFTVLTVKLRNKTSMFISIRELRVSGSRLMLLDDKDKRSLPGFPFFVRRFSDPGGLPLPIPPRSTGTMTFAFPFALSSGSLIRAEVCDFVKFKANASVDWKPVRVIGTEISKTVTHGREHMGLLITVENSSIYPVTSKLRIDLDKLTAFGGKTFFHSEVELQGKERKTLIFRTIPDEGLPMDDPQKETMPDHFRLIDAEVVDCQF